MGSAQFKCGFAGCTFSTDRIEELAAHDVATGHPSPRAGDFGVALTRVQLLCASMGGHEPSVRNPAVCGTCGATLVPRLGGRLKCSEVGCGFSSDDPGELAIHEVTVHGLEEVQPLAQADLQRSLRQSICDRSGHIPNPINPTVCLACGARLEVLRG